MIKTSLQSDNYIFMGENTHEHNCNPYIVTTYDVEEEIVAGVVGGGIKGGAVAHLVVPFPVQVIGHHIDEIQVSDQTEQLRRY